MAVRECLSTGFTVQPPSVGRLLGQRVGHSDSGDRTCFDLIKSTCFAFIDHTGRRDCYSIQDTSLNINMNHAYNFEDYLSDSTIAFIFVDTSPSRLICLSDQPHFLSAYHSEYVPWTQCFASPPD